MSRPQRDPTTDRRAGWRRLWPAVLLAAGMTLPASGSGAAANPITQHASGPYPISMTNPCNGETVFGDGDFDMVIHQTTSRGGREVFVDHFGVHASATDALGGSYRVLEMAGA